MLYRKGHIFSLLTVVILAATLLYSCSPIDLDFNSDPEPGRTDDEVVRTPVREYRNVFILYSIGYNDLRGYLADDIKDVLGSKLMKNRRDVVLMFSHIAKSKKDWPYFDYDTPVSPTLTKISRNPDGSVQRDTLLVMDESTVAASGEVLREVLTYTKENFEAETYGILMSSHGSGWVPAGYLSHPDEFDPQDDDELIPIALQPRKRISSFCLCCDEDIPVKTIGVHYHTLEHTSEMEIPDLAAAFPFKMDYVIFDACYMGGIEVAYELRNVTDKVMFSQTEILADGMDYKSVASYVFAEGGPDLEGFCQRYYDHYNSQSGQFRSATISLIDCTRLEPLAQVTMDMLEKYRNGLNTLQQTRNVQKYYRSAKSYKEQWFYDFGDIMEKCGLSDEDKALFNEKLDDAVIYKAATPWFMSSFKIEHHSGLSMYLPFTEKRNYLHGHYKTLAWNEAVGLIQ